jgi:hypothetical protein
VAYATIVIDDHKENWPVKSHTFKGFMAKQFFDEHLQGNEIPMHSRRH